MNLSMFKRLPVLLLFFTIIHFVVVVNEAVANETVANKTAVVMVNGLEEGIDLSPYLEYIEDSDFSITYDDIESGKVENLWQLNKKNIFVGENENSRYWFRIHIQFAKDIQLKQAVLALPPHARIFSKLKLWLPTGKVDPNSVRHILTGASLAYDTRDIDNRYFGFRIPIVDEELIVVGWSDNTKWGPPAMLPFVLQSTSEFVSDSNSALDIITAFYVIMLVQILYNLCLCIALREPIYGVYSLGLICAISVCAVIDGSILGLNAGNWEYNTLIVRANTFAILTFNLMFVWMSLNTGKMPRLLSKVYVALVMVGGLGVLYSVYVTQFGGSVATFLSLYFYMVPVFIVSIITFGIVKREIIAWYLMIAELVMYSGWVGFGLMTEGEISYSRTFHWGLHWGYAGESLLLALVLAARTRLVQRSAINSLKKYESLFENSFEGRFIYSMEKQSIKCNRAFEVLMEYSEGDELSLELKELLLNSDVTDYELRLIKKNNTEKEEGVWVSINTQLRKDKNEKDFSIEGVVTDISERKLRELAESRNIIGEGIAQAKSQFFASMGHEFKAPLNAVLVYAGLAKRQDVSEEKRVRALESITKSGNHLVTLINNVLDLSKIEADKISIETSSLSDAELLDDVDGIVSSDNSEVKNNVEPKNNSEPKHNTLYRNVETLSLLSHSKILLVDDDEYSINILTSYLSPYSPNIWFASDGEEAVAKIKCQPFDIVVTDFYLPKIIGSLVIKALREDKVNSDAIIICITGSTSADNIKEIYAAGVDLHLPKPISSSDFIDSLCQQIGEKVLKM